ncbi:lysostaphin resistance A-like protein [Chloroflexota bacterium]
MESTSCQCRANSSERRIPEFFFRGIIQGRLERVIGQNKAWIYGGILFGLVHVFTNFFVVGFDLVPGIIQLIMQIISGWIFGILYMKTRSLYPGMFAHFLTNSVLASIVARIFLM